MFGSMRSKKFGGWLPRSEKAFRLTDGNVKMMHINYQILSKTAFFVMIDFFPSFQDVNFC